MTEVADYQVVVDWFSRWWPVLGFGLLLYWGVRMLTRGKKQTRVVNDVSMAVSEIRTTLACSEQQARALLAAYGGNSAKAIMEVKTGKADLPGQEVEDVAEYGGELRSFEVKGGTLEVHTHDGGNRQVSLSDKAMLFIGVVDPEQRADNHGLARADRGPTYGQLYWSTPNGWVRFVLNATRINYFILGDNKVNSGIRNFRLVVEMMKEQFPHLLCDDSVTPLVGNLKAPHYRKPAGFEAATGRVMRAVKTTTGTSSEPAEPQ